MTARHEIHGQSVDADPKRMKAPAILQRGFTLIELMVVIVILAVVLSVGVIAVKPNESALLNQQVAQLKGALLQTCDFAAFEQKIYALVPSQQGLDVYRLETAEWQIAPKTQPLKWSEGVTVSWNLDEDLAKVNKLPEPGWLCWPSGEVLEGRVDFELAGSQRSLSWSQVLRFETHNEFENAP